MAKNMSDTLKDLKQAISDSGLPDKNKLADHIDNLAKIKHLDGRRQK